MRFVSHLRRAVTTTRVVIPPHAAASACWVCRSSPCMAPDLAAVPQACDEVILGNVPVASEDTVVVLSAQAMAVDLGVEMPDTLDGLMEMSLEDYVPLPWRDRHPLSVWAEKVMVHRQRLMQQEPHVVQAEYLTVAKQLPLYGSHCFYVRCCALGVE